MSSYGTAVVPAQTQQPTLDERMRYAQSLAQSGLLPKAYRAQPANVLVAIETGHMLGIAPMAALHGLYIIDGQPSYKAGFIAAQVRRAGHRMRTWFDHDRQVAISTIHRSDDSEFEYRSEWDLDRAQRAQLVQLVNGQTRKRDSRGNPLPWELYPEALLKARTISEVARDACEDLFYGPAYVPEELGAHVDAEGAPLVLDQQNTEQQQARQAAAEQVDWDGSLESLDGDRDGLRQLWALASEYSDEQLPTGFRDRLMAAGARAAADQDDDTGPADDTTQQATQSPHEPDTDTTSEPDRPACDGGRQQPDGEMTLTGENGVVLGICPSCHAWCPCDAEQVLDHVRQDNRQNGGTA